MKDVVKISCVSYSNTLPFRYGLEKSEFIRQNSVIYYDNPAECAFRLLNNEADIGLVPTGTLDSFPGFKIVSDYCLAAQKFVNSVLLLSECDFSEIKTVLLDYQSKTSAKMIQILAKKYWKKNWKFKKADVGYENEISKSVAGLVIGDRALNLAHKYPFAIDIANEWYKFSGIPAVFAVWLANDKLDKDFINQFNLALKSGVKNINPVVEKHQSDFPHFSLENYLKNNIDYKLDEQKKKSLELFGKLCETL